MKNTAFPARLYNDIVGYDFRAGVSFLKNKDIIESAGVMFIHVPKVAGTSVNSSLYGKNLGHFSVRQARFLAPRLFAASFKFGVVRNPWERILSAYNFCINGGTNAVRMSKPWIYKGTDFDNFESFVTNWLAVIDIHKADYIFRPQIDFTNIGGTCLLDFVGRMEVLDNDMRRLSEKIGVKLNVERLNTLGDNASYRDLYNTRMKDIVFDVYKDDIEFFNYEF